MTRTTKAKELLDAKMKEAPPVKREKAKKKQQVKMSSTKQISFIIGLYYRLNEKLPSHGDTFYKQLTSDEIAIFIQYYQFAVEHKEGRMTSDTFNRLREEGQFDEQLKNILKRFQKNDEKSEDC